MKEMTLERFSINNMAPRPDYSHPGVKKGLQSRGEVVTEVESTERVRRVEVDGQTSKENWSKLKLKFEDRSIPNQQGGLLSPTGASPDISAEVQHKKKNYHD